MLTKLDFSVEFASTGKIITGYHEFKPGMTAITGPNESGKSMRLEMIRYALFGVKALRAPSASYKSIKATLEFKVNGVPYVVARSPHSCSVVKDGKMIANGVKATNMAMLDTFGYNLDVFDTANAICQKQAEALTAKTPTDRKKMVDKVIGLNAVDEMIDEVGEEMSTIRGCVTALAKHIGEEPVKPVEPEHYKFSWELKDMIKEERRLEARKSELMATLRAITTEEPTRPAGEPVSNTTVQSLMEEKLKFDSDHKRLAECMVVLNRQEQEWQKIDADWAAMLSQASIEERKKYVEGNFGRLFEAKRKWKLDRAGAVLPEITSDMIPIMTSIIVKDTRQLELESLEDDGMTCPHCKTLFYLQQEKVDELRALINVEIPHEQIVRQLMARLGVFDLKKVLSYQRAWDLYDAVMAVPEPPVPPGPDLGSERNVQESIEQHAKMLEGREKFIQLERDIEVYKTGLNDREDPTERLHDARARQVEWDKYNAALELWNKFQEQEKKIMDELVTLPDTFQVEELELNLETAQQYDRELHQYNNDLTKFEFAKAEMKESEAVLERLTLVRKALQDIKPKVKSYLMPSLNRVASNLISQMTNGARNKIEISENFDILVDGQSVSEMSGSGEAIVNLAIRLALGTVLTNKVFSVLLCDEVDASMDKERASYTAECLRNLKTTIGQIVIVSHQKPEADHQIEL